MTTRNAAFFLAALVASFACGSEQALAQSSGRKPIPPPDKAKAKASHERMLGELKKILDKTDGENGLLGTVNIKVWQDRLAKLDAAKSDATKPELAKPELRFKVLVELGDAMVYYGQEREGLKVLQQAFDMDKAQIPDELYQDSKIRYAACWLRLAETENCCASHSAESCILPIQGAALHTKKEGSTNAVKLLSEVLAATNKTSPNHLRAEWFLNVAEMTLGGYPDKVPEENRIPPAFFKGTDFPHFTNVAGKVGVDFMNLAGGAIADDFDNDGDIDLLMTSYGADGQLEYMTNEGGVFKRSTEKAGLIGLLGGLNIIQADYDNDGWIDAYIPRGAWLGKIGLQPDSLLHNNGDGTFTDVAYVAGIAGVDYPDITAVFTDYDNDGDLDIYVGNETDANVKAPNQLFRNNGDGTFTDVAEKAGVMNMGYSRSVLAGDIDGDRDADLWVSNLNEDNRLYRNNGDGTFTDIAPQQGMTGPKKSYTSWFFDFDNDGALDLHVNAFGAKPADLAAAALGLSFDASLATLYKGDGKGGFKNVGREVGLTQPYSCMGGNLGDYNNDGYLDFYAGTGRPEARDLVPDKAYLNVGGKTYADITIASGLGNVQKGHGRSFADFDNDGDLDVFAQMGGAFKADLFHNALYENPGFPGTHFIDVKLQGVASNACAMGARIRADIVEGGTKRSIFRWVGSGGSFGANPLRQHIGLGKCEKLESMEVFWPTTGKAQVFKDLPLDRFVRIVEGSDKPEILELKPFKLGGAKDQGAKDQ